MNILVPSIILFFTLYILIFNKKISYSTMRIIILIIISLSLIYTIISRFKPDKTNYFRKCFINEKKNKLGPGKCFFDSDCRGARFCSSEGKCVGNSKC